MTRRSSPTNALYVRLPATAADKLDRAAEMLGARKKDLVAGLVSRYVDPDSKEGLGALSELAAGAPGGMDAEDDSLRVGSYSFHRYELPEVLTPAQAADLLQLSEQVVIELAESGELPGRKLGDQWRFARVAIVASLSGGVQQKP